MENVNHKTNSDKKNQIKIKKKYESGSGENLPDNSTKKPKKNPMKDQCEYSYYDDDSHGYEIYQPDKDETEE